MNRELLDLVNAAIAASLAVEIKEHVPGDVPEDHEDNTFGLPEGAPLRRKLRRYFRDQLRRIVGFVGKIGAELPHRFPPMADYNDAMASAMTPILGVYWDKAGRGLRERMGLDPDEWRVSDPNLHKAIARQSYKFCASTNATTDRELGHALGELKEQLRRGLIVEGETIAQLADRVRLVFKRADNDRAAMIARTEASRAVHDATIETARGSGLVSRKKWLTSANSCPLCHRLADQVGAIGLDAEFARVGKDPDYSAVRFPPAHPHCRCTLTFELIGVPDAPPIPAYVAPASKEPGDSGPNLVAGRGVDLGHALEYASKLAGKPVTARDLVALSGAQGDATVRVSEASPGSVTLRVKSKTTEATRRILAGDDGRPFAVNEKLWVRPTARGKGAGAEIFGRQVEAAARLGFSRIETFAAGGQGFNGYWTWPRFGYDAAIPADVAAALPRGLAGSARISDLMATEAGRAWWKAEGVPLDVAFDLSPSSTSRRVWDGYRAGKARVASKAARRPVAGDGADFTAEDLAIADRTWDTLRENRKP